MRTLFVDTALLAVPGYAECKEDVEVIFNRISYWSAQARRGECTIALMSSAVDFLATFNYFPIAENVKALIDLFELNAFYSVEDLRRAYNSLLERMRSIIDSVGLEVVSVETLDVKEIVGDEWTDENLKEQSVLTLSSAMCAKKFKLKPGIIFVSAIPKLNESKIYAELRGAFIETTLEWVLEGDFINVSGQIDVISNWDGMRHVIEAESIWNSAEDDFDLFLAIATRWVELKRAAGESVGFSDLPNFYVGSEFRKSLVEHQAFGDSKYGGAVLDVCARLLFGEAKYPESRLWKLNSTGKREYVTRNDDSADAYRTHVTKHHDGVRLMYWRVGDKIEFANVSMKSAVEIELGSAAPCTMSCLRKVA